MTAFKTGDKVMLRYRDQAVLAEVKLAPANGWRMGARYGSSGTTALCRDDGGNNWCQREFFRGAWSIKSAGVVAIVNLYVTVHCRRLPETGRV
jgi:hypothetical protein